jgi:hypothetical protein
MDGDRFDSVTRLSAMGSDRRAVIKRCLSALGGVITDMSV